MDINAIMRQAQELQEKMNRVQEDLAGRHVTATSGGGMVSVTCNGKQEITAITVEETVVDPSDVRMLEDLILTAVNEALRQSRELAATEMGALTGGLRLPGM